MNPRSPVLPLLLSLLIALAVPLTASGQEALPAPNEGDAERQGPTLPPDPEPEPESATLSVNVKGLKGGKVPVGESARVFGTVRPFVANQKVRVRVLRGRRLVERRLVPLRALPSGNAGRYEAGSGKLLRSGKYRFEVEKIATEAQEGAARSSRKFGISYPNLNPGQRSKFVKLFNRLLKKEGYYTSGGPSYGSATSRAVLAFRKVNNMSRNSQATPGIFRTLANGKGGFKVKWKGGGKHVETDLSRQVMALVKNGKAKHVFHISSGAPATPTIRGKMTFFRKEFGTNSLGMIHSVYFGPTDRGYATHGYRSVPNYPASHGCLRNPPPNSRFIYDWIDLGDYIYVYG